MRVCVYAYARMCACACVHACLVLQVFIRGVPQDVASWKTHHIEDNGTLLDCVACFMLHPAFLRYCFAMMPSRFPPRMGCTQGFYNSRSRIGPFSYCGARRRTARREQIIVLQLYSHFVPARRISGCSDVERATKGHSRVWVDLSISLVRRLWFVQTCAI